MNLFNNKKTSTRRILVVEDDAMLSRVLTEALKKDKFKIEIVANGSEVLAAVARFAPALILLDLVIPGIDGFEVLKQLKADSKTAAIPVVVLSNLDQPSDVKAVKALGADQYFLKATTKMDVIIQFVKDRLNK